MAEVSERRVRPIQEAVSNQQWKQALQLCEKWHKKGEKSDRFLAIRALVLAKQPDQTSITRGQNELVQLCERNPAIKDPGIIHQLGDALKDLKINHSGKASLWERAALDNPGSKELAGYWVDAAIEQGDWKGAQKATMALRKVVPTDRNYDFWNIFMNYMMSKDDRLPEKERSMYRTLAYRMLGRAVEAVPTGKQQDLSSGKAVLSPEELYLLVRIYIDCGQAKAAQTLLTGDERLGLGSTIEQLDRDLHSSLVLDVMEAAKDWSELVLRLKDSLVKGLNTDPHVTRLLKILIDAAENSKDQSHVPDLRSFLDVALKTSPDSQILRHADMRLAAIELGTANGTASKSLTACQNYFSLRRTKVSCFDELYPTLGNSSPEFGGEFVHVICKGIMEKGPFEDAIAIITMLNLFRLEYCLIFPQDRSLTTGVSFAAKVLDFYSKQQAQSLTDSNLASQFLLLASMIILKLAQDGVSATKKEDQFPFGYLLSCFLLRFVGEVGIDYLVPTLLCRIYTLLGALTLSSQLFQSLSIKNLQFDNTGHLLLTRISTLSTPELEAVDEVPDPLDVLDQAMAANKRALGSVQKYIMGGLECKSYINVMEAVELRERLKSSISQKMYRLEKARIDRLGGRFDLSELSFHPGSSYDARDYKFIPSYEHSGPTTFAERLETGPRPRAKWVHIMKICHDIAKLLFRDKQDPQSITKADLSALVTSLANLQDLLNPPDLAADELTAVEISNSILQMHLGRSWVACRDSSLEATHTPDTPSPLVNLETWLLSTRKAFTNLPTPTPGPTWTYFHRAYSALDSLIMISLFLDCTASQPGQKSKSKAKLSLKPPKAIAAPISKDQHNKLSVLVAETTEAIRSSARQALAVVEKADSVDQMMDDIFGASQEGPEEWRELGKMVERWKRAREVAEGMCLDLKESWSVGLKGILGVKVGAV